MMRDVFLYPSSIRTDFSSKYSESANNFSLVKRPFYFSFVTTIQLATLL